MISTRRARIYLAVAIVLCTLFAYQYAMRLQQLSAVEAQAVAMRGQVEQEQQRQHLLEAELDALDDPEFLDRVARGSLDYAKPGDKVVVVLKDAPVASLLRVSPESQSADQSVAVTAAPVWRQWVDFFASDLTVLP